MAPDATHAAIADSDPDRGVAPGPRNHFQSHPGLQARAWAARTRPRVRREGKVTVKHDVEPRKHPNVEEWIWSSSLSSTTARKREIPELEIDVDELLDMESDDTRAARVKELLVGLLTNPLSLLDKIRGMQKLEHTPRRSKG